MDDDAKPARQPALALLCGSCSNRRVLTHLRVWPERWTGDDFAEGPMVAPTATGQRKWRPSVEAGPTADRAVSGEPLRLRCKRGHAWTLDHEELVGACLGAMALSQWEIVAGVDIG